MDPQRQLALLLEFSDMLRVSLAGNLKDFQVVNAAGELVRGDKIFYGAYPAAYAENPWETVNYGACHDNETLFDQVNPLLIPYYVTKEAPHITGTTGSLHLLLRSFISA